MSFSAKEQMANSRSSKLMESAEITNSSILPTDQGFRLWRYFETPAYRRLYKSQEFMEKTALDLLSKFSQNIKNSSLSYTSKKLLTDIGGEIKPVMQRQCLIEVLLNNSKLSWLDIVGTAADLLLAGIDTTSYTTGFALHHIATSNHNIQERLFEEAKRVMTNKDSPLTADCLSNRIPFTRAVLKEVFRLNPISVGVGRILTEDMVFSDYHVPKGVSFKQ